MAKRGHRFEITVAPIPVDGGEAAAAPALRFVHVNHDDILRIVEHVRGSNVLDQDSAAAVAVGTKLLAEVMLAHKDTALFDPLRAALRAFIAELKSLPA